MKKALRTVLAGLLVVPLLALGVTVATGTVDVAAQIGDGIGATADAANPGGEAADLETIIRNVINIMLYIIGAIAVIMLIYGGIRYTTSGGNANSVTAAKNTIIYAILGLVVAIFAYAIVNWVWTTTTGN